MTKVLGTIEDAENNRCVYNSARAPVSCSPCAALWAVSTSHFFLLTWSSSAQNHRRSWFTNFTNFTNFCHSNHTFCGVQKSPGDRWKGRWLERRCDSVIGRCHNGLGHPNFGAAHSAAEDVPKGATGATGATKGGSRIWRKHGESWSPGDID